MPKPKTPPLADWEVNFSWTATRVVSAAHVHVREGAVLLADSDGRLLLAAPLTAIRYVRRLEPGEVVPEAQEAPEAPAGTETAAEPGPGPGTAAAETVATPAQRKRRGTRA